MLLLFTRTVQAACGENYKRVGGTLFGSGGALSHKTTYVNLNKHSFIQVLGVFFN